MPGLGKSFRIQKEITRCSGDLANTTLYVLLSGEISKQILERTFRSLLNRTPANPVTDIFIKVEYIINLNSQKDFLNNFLFKLCYMKYICIQGEHYFLEDKVRVHFEIATYHNKFLLKNISFLECLPLEECKFKLAKYEFQKHLLSDEQIVGYSLDHYLLQRKTTFIDYGDLVFKELIAIGYVSDGQGGHILKNEQTHKLLNLISNTIFKLER